MTIYLYTGRPGNGKSFHACRDIRDHLKYKKADVISNFGVSVDDKWAGRFNYLQNSQLTASWLVSYAVDYWGSHKFKEDGILLVIDECQLLFNSRTWNDKERLNWIEFFSQHRKYGYKVILIAQDDCMIDKQFRTLIEYETNHRKAMNYGLFGLLLTAVFMGTVFYCPTYYYMQNQKLSGTWVRYSKRIARMYNSYDAFKQVRGADGGRMAAGGLPNVSDPSCC